MGKATATRSKTEQRLDEARSQLAKVQAEIRPFELADRPVPAALRLELAQAEAAVRQASLIDQYGHRAGTPETYAKINAVDPGKRQNPVARMFEDGQLTEEQFDAANQIAAVVEAIERSVSVRGASLEARVDCSGAARDLLIESLALIRLDVIYSAWRNRLPTPKRLVIDMLTANRSLVATARVHRVNWRKARKWMLSALDRWIEIREQHWHAIGEDDVQAIYAKLGCGVLMPPQHRAAAVAGDE